MLKQKKLCKICLDKKDYQLFSKNCVNDDGLSHMCKECCSAYRKHLRIKHKQTDRQSRIKIIPAPCQQVFSVSFE